MTTQKRADRADLQLPKAKKLEEGQIRGYMRVAKVGPLEYEDGNGGKTIEYVDAQTLSDPEAIESLKMKPIVWEHPPEDVDPGNIGQVRIGQIGEDVSFDGKYLIASYIIDTRAGLRAIDLGLREMSPGYTVELETRADGKSYQRDRRYNHAAFTIQGRGGPDVVARVDGATMQQLEQLIEKIKEEASSGGASAVAEIAARLDSSYEEKKKLDGEIEELKGKLDALMKEREDMMKEKDEDKRGDSAAFMLSLNKRRKLEAAALTFGVEAEKVQSLTTSELRRETARRVDSSISEDATPEYIDGVIAGSMVAAPAKKDGRLDSLKQGSAPVAVSQNSNPFDF